MSTVADLRKLHHHVSCKGAWNYHVDTRRLARGIQRIERLEAYLMSLANDTPHVNIREEIHEVLNGTATVRN